MVYLTRKSSFSAGHKYQISGLSEDENKKLFGKSGNIHGHNYTLEVTVKGEPDEKTGMVINLNELDRIIKKEVIELLDHTFLNEDIDCFKNKIPSTENLALFIWDRLVKSIKKADLYRIRIHEKDDTYVEYCGE